MTDTQTVLRNARELLSDEARWCKEHWCEGAGCGLRGAKRLSLPAAVVASAESESVQIACIGLLLDALPSPADSLRCFEVLADTTHADVLKVLDEAIARVKGWATGPPPSRRHGRP